MGDGGTMTKRGVLELFHENWGTEREVECECGYVVRADSAAELVTNIEVHVQRDHARRSKRLVRVELLARASSE